jgi:hypothetical protein
VLEFSVAALYSPVAPLVARPIRPIRPQENPVDSTGSVK